MQLPRFTAKSALVYLIGAAALLLLVYLLILIVLRARPRKSVPVHPGATATLQRSEAQARFAAACFREPALSEDAARANAPREPKNGCGF